MSGGIERPRFRPTASPVNTVAVDTNFTSLPQPVAPVKPVAPVAPDPITPPVKSNVDQLVQALAALNPTLNRFMGNWFEEQNKQDQTDAELAFMRDNTVSSWADAVRRDPTLADKSPVFRQVFESRIAKTQVQKRAGELIAEYWNSPLVNSEDPNAINSWLSEKMKDLLDTVESPAAKQAMIEELQNVSSQFINSHRENARRNLLIKNEESVSSRVQTMFDNYAAQGPAAPYQTDDPVFAASLSTSGDARGAMKAAFLNAIAGGESAGKYNIRYTPKGGALFSDMSRHPRIFEPGPEGPSSAAGRYQITWSTWERLGFANASFSPENQDKAALKLAEEDYRDRTGRNLWDDMEKEGFSPRIQAVLAPTWAALKGNRGRHLATYNASLQKYGKDPVGPGARNAFVPEMVEEIHKIEYEAKAQGLHGSQVNRLTTAAIVNAAITHMDESLLDVAMQPRPDGSPGPGMTVEGRQKIEEARVQIRRLQIQEQNHKWTLEQRQKEIRKDQVAQAATDALLGQMKAGQPPRIPLDVLQTANKEDPELAKTLIDVQKNLDDVHKVEDPLEVAGLTARVFSGQASQAEVIEAIEKGRLKTHGTIQSLLEFAGRRGLDNPINDPTIKPIADNIRQVVGVENMPGIMQKPLEGGQAVSAFAMHMLKFKEENPNASATQLLAEARKVQAELIKIYRPDLNLDAATPEGVQRQNATLNPSSAVTAPNGDKKAEAPAIQPREGVEWRKVPLWNDPKQLDLEMDAFIKGGTINNFALWIQKLGLTSQEQITEFIVTQKRLMQSQTKR